MLRDYVSQLYIPATAAFRTRSANGARIAGELWSWQTQIEKYWPEIHFGKLRVKKDGNQWGFQVAVYLAELDAAFVSVELYADGAPDSRHTCIVMNRGERLVGAANAYTYSATAPAERPAEDYTPRIIPAHPEVRVPLEDAHILWMR
jgi:starch phosphorylase